jgi:lipopolysaccharide transport system permease protein
MFIIKSIYNFLSDIINSRYLIYEMTKNDFKKTYTGSWLGILWTFIQPLALTMIFLLIFGMGFRGGAPIGDVPFVVWFLSAMFPWQFFSGALGENTRVINNYSYLVKKVNFRVSIVTIVKILSNSIVHIIFMMILVIVMFIYDIPADYYWLQIVYYFIAMFVLLLGLSWLFSSMNVFASDVSNVISIILRLGFFFTPIFWKIDNVAETYRFIFKLNPMYYIVQGYRDSFINHVPFWYHGFETIYFWIFTLISLFIGILVFHRLRPHFGDVV